MKQSINRINNGYKRIISNNGLNDIMVDNLIILMNGFNNDFFELNNYRGLKQW